MAKKIPDILTLEEQERLLDQFNLRYITPHRNKVMIRLMLDTGLRLGEVLNLEWKNVDLLMGRLKVVQSKGAKDRLLWIDEYLSNMLDEWKERQFNEWGKSDYIFTTRSLNKIDGRSFRRTVDIYITKAGIEKNIHPHSFRHTFASDMLREVKDLRQVQKALGHSDISSTQLYTHIVDEELEKSMKDFRNRGRSDG